MNAILLALVLTAGTPTVTGQLPPPRIEAIHSHRAPGHHAWSWWWFPFRWFGF